MKTDVKKLSRGQMEITVELTVDEFHPFLEKAAQTISQQVKIPGFRPGKATLDQIKQRVGEGELWNEALEPAVQKTLVKVLDEQKLMTVGSPKIDVVKLAPGNPIIYKATVSLFPEVSLGDYSKIKIAKKPVEVKPEQIEKVLADLQKMHSTEALVNREAKMGDKVEISFKSFLDKIPVDGGSSEKFPLVIGEKTFIPGFEEQLVGLSENQNKEFQLKFPENYHQKNLAGKFVDFKTSMHAVYELTPPKLDDDFAKRLGGFTDFADLKSKITDNIKAEEEQKESQRLEDEIVDKLLSVSTFGDIPDVLIDAETKKMIEELEHNISHQGLSFEEYLNHIHKTRAELLLEFAPQATKRIKAAVVLRAIREQANISVSDTDIDEEIKQTLALYAGNPEVEKSINTPDYRDYLRNVIASRKVIEYLKSNMVQ